METYVRFGIEHPDHYIVTFVLKAAPYEQPGHGESRKAKAGLQCFGDMRNLVRRCMEEGKLKQADPEETTQALWAGIHGLTTLLRNAAYPICRRWSRAWAASRSLYVGGNRILATAVLVRRTAHDFLKGFREGASGFVAKGPRDFRNRIAGVCYSVPG